MAGEYSIDNYISKSEITDSELIKQASPRHMPFFEAREKFKSNIENNIMKAEKKIKQLESYIADQKKMLKK